MDNNSRLVYKRIKKLLLPVRYYPEFNFLDIKLGRRHYFFHRVFFIENNAAGIYCSRNKYLANKILKKHHFPVPKSIQLNKIEYSSKNIKTLISNLAFPLVVKPNEGTGRGNGVLSNIKKISTLKEHIQKLFQSFDTILIEEYYKNAREYRVLVYDGKVAGVVERFGASVIGNGINTIQELIDEKNKPRYLLEKKMTVAPIVTDMEYTLCLEEQGIYSFDYIPKINQKIKLCNTANTGRGGDIYSHGKKINGENAKQIVDAVSRLGLNYAGVDIICENINTAFTKNNWMIIEVNYCPDTTIHEIPYAGKRAPILNRMLRKLIRKHLLSYFYHLLLKLFTTSRKAF